MIGGTDPGQRNVISSNSHGICISGSSAQYNNVQGNWIGLSLQGDSANPNAAAGVFITYGAAHNTIGGDTAAQGNYISGNVWSGVYIQEAGSDGNRLGGNVIGMGADDQTPLRNKGNGVVVCDGPQDNRIGGDGLAENTIIANLRNGVSVENAHGNKIEGNVIYDNQEHGIHFWRSDNAQIIANVITRNGLDGIYVGTLSIHNLITANSIYNNGELGINLIFGGNGELPAPAITFATPDGASGTACPGCTVEVYSDQEDEGQTYHGNTTADASGNWAYAGTTLSGPNATAINRSDQNDTSEFSAPISVTLCTPVTAVTINGPTNGEPGRDICFNASTTPPGATLPIDFAWSPGALSSGQGTAAACYNWSQPGTYQVAITATNCAGTALVQDTHTIVITDACTALHSVDTSGPSSGQVGVAACFTATVSPANASAPIDYLWDPLPDGQGTPFACHTWFTPGTHTITVTAGNCSGAGMAQDIHTVTISAGRVPVSAVTISGPSTGLAGTSYGFSAVVTPANASGPLLYTWDPAPSSGRGSASAAYSWPAAGQYGLQLTVSNCGGTGTAGDDHTIAISAGTLYQVYLPAVSR